jgi:hypothetical protein
MNSRDNTGDKLMNEQGNPQVDVPTRILNKVLAKLYLTIAPAHSPRAEELVKFDSKDGIERPSAIEIRRAIKELVEFDRDLGNGMRFRIIEELLSLDKDFGGEGRIRIEEQFNRVLVEERLPLTDAERQRLFESIVAEILGLGPLEPLLAEGAVTAIMVDGYDRITVDRQRGRLEDTPYRFRDNDHLMAVIGRIFGPLRQHPDESFPIADVRLSDGSRVNVVMPPISLIGPVMTIQAFEPYRGRFTVENLIHYGSGSREILEFLRNRQDDADAGHRRDDPERRTHHHRRERRRHPTQTRRGKNPRHHPGGSPTQQRRRRGDHRSGPVHQCVAHAS